MSGCELCEFAGGEVVFSTPLLRVVLVDDAHYPGFCRVIWQSHVVEMTDLSVTERDTLMRMVWQVETVLREVMQPDKINLAAFANVVPHLHWHVIPRYRDDVHFPVPVWALAQRAPDAAALERRCALLPLLRVRLVEMLVA